MIIFEIEGCLADNRHRLHLVDPSYNPGNWVNQYDEEGDFIKQMHYEIKDKKWKPNWPAYWDACDKDEPINQAIQICNFLRKKDRVHIWSGRPDYLGRISLQWFRRYLPINKEFIRLDLNLRPEGETCSDEVLFERWLDEYALKRIKTFTLTDTESLVEMAFSGNPNVIEMWKRRGVPCFQVHV